MIKKALLLATASMAIAPAIYAQQHDVVIITATKTETDLQDTPISVAVLDDEQLVKRNAGSLLDLSDGSVPSLRIATFESRQSALTVGMRGIVPGDANQPAREQGVGVYLDGVYMGRQHGLNAGFLDIERVEVLRGPQGTLFGRNTEGGAVNIISKSPTGVFGGSFSAGVGNYGIYSGNFRLNLPEFAGVSVKMDAGIQHQDATTKNPTQNQYGWNYHHRYGGRIAARWEPTDTFRADIAVDSSRDQNTPYFSQLINYNPLNRPVATLSQIAAAGNKIPSGYVAPLPSVVVVQPDRAKSAAVGVPQEPSIGKSSGITSTLTWDINDDLEFKSITARREVSDRQFDNSGSANRTPVFVPNATFSRYSIAKLNQEQFSQEFQLIGSMDNLTYVVGAYYFTETADDEARTPNTNKWNAFGTAYTFVDPSTYSLTPIARASQAEADSYALYGQATYTVNDDWHFTLGGRVTEDKKNGKLFTVNGASTNLTFRQENRRFDPLATLVYDFNDDINVYAKYTTGYRAGGASSRSLIYRSFGPESVKSYEIGSKMDLFDNTRLNVAAYTMDRKDSQVDFNFFVPQPNGTVRNTLETVNAEGTTKIKGLEVDLTVEPIDDLKMAVSYAYTDTLMPLARNTVQEQLNALLTPPNLSPVFQKVFITYTPEHALSASVDYDIVDWSFHIDGNYSSPQYTFDNEDVQNEESFVVNTRVSKEFENFTVSIWSRNLFDTSYIYRRSNANGTVLGDYANFNEPRTFGIDFTTNF